MSPKARARRGRNRARRRWRRRLDAGVSAVTVTKAYRLLKAVLNTAADDGLIRRNPCRIKGASVEKSLARRARLCGTLTSGNGSGFRRSGLLSYR